MIRARALTLALCLLALSQVAHAADPPLHFGRFGELTLVSRGATPERVVVLLSGDDGWNPRADAIAQSFAGYDALVIGVDSRAWLKALASGSSCAYPAGELEALSQFVQKELGRPRYGVPYLAGIGSGAALAQRALAQAPRDTFRAGLGYDPTTAASLTFPFCSPHHPASGSPPAWIAVDSTTNDAIEMLGARFAELAGRTSAARPELDPDLSDLPLVQIAATGTPAPFAAVILSGDGGWASLDREIGGSLAAQGIPVLGFDSLQYFWTPRTPEQSAAALGRVLDHARDAWPDRRLVLIGYSRGADVLPFMVGRLTDEQRARIALVVLIGPGERAEFEFHVLDWIGPTDPSAGLPIAPEVAKLRGMRVLCIYGRDEAESACREIDPALATRDERPGGHHFDGDYDAVAKTIARELAR